MLSAVFGSLPAASDRKVYRDFFFATYRSCQSLTSCPSGAVTGSDVRVVDARVDVGAEGVEGGAATAVRVLDCC